MRIPREYQILTNAFHRRLDSYSRTQYPVSLRYTIILSRICALALARLVFKQTPDINRSIAERKAKEAIARSAWIRIRDCTATRYTLRYAGELNIGRSSNGSARESGCEFFFFWITTLCIDNLCKYSKLDYIGRCDGGRK